MELSFEVNPVKFFRRPKIFGFNPYFSAKYLRKIQPVCTPLDPIRCVPACDVKYSGLGSSRPIHYPQSHAKYLSFIVPLLRTTTIELSMIEDAWSLSTLRGDSHQIVKDAEGESLFQSSIIPVGSVYRRIASLFQGSRPRFCPGFKVLVRDAFGSTVLTMICTGSNFNGGSETDEMEVFLAKCKLSIGKVVKLPSVFKEYAVSDERGDRIYHILIFSSVIENSCIVSTYKIFHVQLKRVVGIIKCSKRTWARFVPNSCIGYGPYALTYEKVLPLTHKALLLGASYFLVSAIHHNRTDESLELNGAHGVEKNVLKVDYDGK